MEIKEILDAAKAEAFKTHFEADEASVLRSFYREFSKKFFVPLPEAEKLDLYYVALHLFEDHNEKFELTDKLEDFLDQIYTMEDPEYARVKEENMEEFIQLSQARESKRLGKKEQENTPENQEAQTQEKPTGGSVDFTNMDPSKEG